MITLETIAKHTGGSLKGDPAMRISGIAPADSAGPEQLTFLSDAKKQHLLEETKAGAVIVHPAVTTGPANRIETENPYLAFARTTELFAEKTGPETGVHPTAVIDETTEIDAAASVGAFCVIGKNVTIGAGTVLHPHVVVGDKTRIGNHCEIYSRVSLYADTQIGNRVIIHSGAVIGSDGFGFAEDQGRYVKIQQLGNVEIGDDVEIGANTCIDRGALGPTVVADGAKLDNLIQIAHNVRVGENTGIAAQVGISGSTEVGQNVKLAGQVGLAGHLKIGDKVFIGAQSGVNHNIPEGTMVFGYPAREMKKAGRIEAIISALPDWIKRIRALEKKIASKESE